MIKKVVQIGDSVLETICDRVGDPNSQETQDLVQDLLDTCISLSHRSAGISAPQIGILKHVCICRRTDLEEQELEKNPDNPKKIPIDTLWEVMINPEIKIISSTKSSYWEGCLSIGEEETDTIFGPVEREDLLELEYTNRAGERIKTQAKDFYAHVVQHELDHLNGELFIHKVETPDKNLWKAPKLNSYIDKEGKYPKIV